MLTFYDSDLKTVKERSRSKFRGWVVLDISVISAILRVSHFVFGCFGQSLKVIMYALLYVYEWTDGQVLEAKSATTNIFRKKYFLFKAFVKVGLSYVFTINLFTIAENCMVCELSYKNRCFSLVGNYLRPSNN